MASCLLKKPTCVITLGTPKVKSINNKNNMEKINAECWANVQSSENVTLQLKGLTVQDSQSCLCRGVYLPSSRCGTSPSSQLQFLKMFNQIKSNSSMIAMMVDGGCFLQVEG